MSGLVDEPNKSWDFTAAYMDGLSWVDQEPSGHVLLWSTNLWEKWLSHCYCMLLLHIVTIGYIHLETIQMSRGNLPQYMVRHSTEEPR